MFISNAYAQTAAAAGAGASLTANVIQILLIFLVFYLLLIRPQQKKLKQHEAELKAIKVGDKVLTAGGLYAVVRKIENDDLTLEISKGVEVTANRFTIREVLADKHEVHAQKQNTKGKKNV
ncbi:MAG: preprotein translocase subunit YajC [Alphaproteobacteria bacterium]|nr:preprotein translocase subunit YajC [Alphaproteobacteria bacterium]